MSTFTGSSRLAKQANKFLYEDSLHSSDSSIDLHRSLSPTYRSRPRSTRRHTETQLNGSKKTGKDTKPKLNQTVTTVKSPSQRLKSPEHVINNDTARSKPFGKKCSLKSTQSEGLVNPKSCQQEKYLLRIKVSGLESTINNQNKKVKKLYERVLEKREEVKTLTDQLLESRKKSLDILELKEKVKALEVNEKNLVEELNNQQKEAKNMLYKLYDLQEEWSFEAERSKKEYKEYCTDWLEEQKAKWKANISLLEEENWRLVHKIKEVEAIEEIERKRRESSVHTEILSLRADLNDKDLEIERLKDDIRAFREAMKESERVSLLEKKSLMNSIDILTDQNRALRLNEEDAISQEQYEKHQLRRKVELLHEELQRKDRVIKEKELGNRDQIDALNKRISSLQLELKSSGIYQERVDQLEKSLAMKENELSLSKKLYEEKLESKRSSQDQQKKEWSHVYHEMLDQIKGLKGEVSNLQGNHRNL